MALLLLFAIHTVVLAKTNAMPTDPAVLRQAFSWEAVWEEAARPVTSWVQAGPGKDSMYRWYLLLCLGEAECMDSGSSFTLGCSQLSESVTAVHEASGAVG